jgi:hypothetical protein
LSNNSALLASTSIYFNFTNYISQGGWAALFCPPLLSAKGGQTIPTVGALGEAVCPPLAAFSKALPTLREPLKIQKSPFSLRDTYFHVGIPEG